MTSDIEPKLDKPGAGVSWPQKMVMRYIVRPFVAARASWEDSEAAFVAVTREIEAEIAGLSSEQLNKKILVPPQYGLEDSSRFWSVAMTLEHLVIVGNGISGIVRRLSSGKTMSGQSDTALVKPRGQKTAEQDLADFKRFCQDDFPALLPSIADRASLLTYRHAWFGDMTAREWYWLLASHQKIHLRQIREITVRLKILALVRHG